VKQLLEMWARGMKDGMVTAPLKDSLSAEEGKHSTGVITDKARKDLAGSGTSNDMSERVLAVFTNVLKELRKIRWTSASAHARALGRRR